MAGHAGGVLQRRRLLPCILSGHAHTAASRAGWHRCDAPVGGVSGAQVVELVTAYRVRCRDTGLAGQHRRWLYQLGHVGWLYQLGHVDAGPSRHAGTRYTHPDRHALAATAFPLCHRGPGLCRHHPDGCASSVDWPLQRADQRQRQPALRLQRYSESGRWPRWRQSPPWRTGWTGISPLAHRLDRMGTQPIDRVVASVVESTKPFLPICRPIRPGCAG